MIFITLAETERCILSSVSQCGAVQVHKTVDFNSRNAAVPAAQSSSVVLMGSYEEAQQNWLLPDFTVLTVFWQVQEDTLHTYLCETEYIYRYRQFS